MNYDEWIVEFFSKPPRNTFKLDWPKEFVERIDDLSSREKVDLFTKTFENAGTDIAPFPDEQVAVGIQYITSDVEGFLQSIRDIEVPCQERFAAIKSIYSLYRNCYARRCDEKLSHLRKDDSEEINPLNTPCYMLWDSDILNVRSFGNDPHREMMIETILDVLIKTLAIPHVACQEGALHGLGHARMDANISRFPKDYSAELIRKIDKIIDDFLEENEMDVDLRKYALQARAGVVL